MLPVIQRKDWLYLSYTNPSSCAHQSHSWVHNSRQILPLFGTEQAKLPHIILSTRSSLQLVSSQLSEYVVNFGELFPYKEYCSCSSSGLLNVFTILTIIWSDILHRCKSMQYPCKCLELPLRYPALYEQWMTDSVCDMSWAISKIGWNSASSHK